MSNIGNCFPNSFSPDGNGYDDSWLPVGVNLSADGYLLKIYDSHDNLIFKTDNCFEGWNGKVGEVVCPKGVYNYTLKYMTLNGEKHNASGMFQLTL